MAAPLVRAARIPVTGRLLSTSAALCQRAAPLGPLPNQQFEGKDLDSLKKYRSFARYKRVAEAESQKSAWWRTYKEYLYPKDADETSEKVDIGLPYYRPSPSERRKVRSKILRDNHSNPELEKAARLRTLQIPLDEVRADWERTCGPHHIQRAAEHYGVYKDLFGEATFVPRVALRVRYTAGDDTSAPVHYGNLVTPSEAAVAPEVTFDAQEGSLWTLLLTNPDGHLRDADSEYVHWLVGNIPGNRVLSGDEVCHYFPPFPAKGTGYHRYVFILFKQEEPINYTEETRPNPCHSLKRRTFKTLDFYRKYEEKITAAGLAFFQCQWDDRVTQVFHHLLNMREPVFEHQFPPVYHPKQKKFPYAQLLRYLDRYRDSEELDYGIY